MEQTIADTIVWMAEERMKESGYKNLVSGIYAVSMEVELLVGQVMAEKAHACRLAKVSGQLGPDCPGDQGTGWLEM